ncbi:MAG: aldehyde ferredoxin oxidoreductase C-terminal domain-containing protein [Gammaproteobacteria bacterium]|nr:aldehyde ferredoxin oxidoreductase C-terminal domain-containing protein [Gammaproteobacteria bacterium]
MRKYLDIDLHTKTVNTTELEGQQIANAGRYFIAKTLVECGAARVDPLSPENPLIFSAGPFAGTNFSNANRTSVGCKSPLTGGIKESNAGGTFSVALGQLHIAGLTLHGAADEWILIHIAKDGTVSFDSGEPYLGMGNFEAAEKLHERFGKKVSLALCGPVGEYQGLLAGIAISDTDRRPSRLAARGGVGAVMGSKKVKAIVAELNKMPELHERKKVMSAVKEYNKKLQADELIETYTKIGTASMADFTNYIGGLPVRNFSSGRLVGSEERMKMGGSYIRELNLARGGDTSHACMPGCMIKCSNVYVDADGKEITSPVEYETLGLMGTNCGLKDPDDLARLNNVANDLGIDSIETGAMIAVLMEAGVGDFGDVDFMFGVLDEIRKGSEKGRIYAQGTARVGDHFGVGRIPVIKKQAISAYDPRVIEVTGVTMMATAQGADHTAGNVPRMQTNDKALDEIVDASMEAQVLSAAADSLGLCIFGRSVTNTNLDMIAEAINNAVGTSYRADFFEALGRETLKLEDQFNREAGFSVDDDELPDFFYREALPPSDNVARFHSAEVRRSIDRWWKAHA